MTPELIACYDIIARLISLGWQYAVPIQAVGQMLLGTKFEPSDPVRGHAGLKFCSSVTDAIARHLLMVTLNLRTLEFYEVVIIKERRFVN